MLKCLLQIDTDLSQDDFEAAYLGGSRNAEGVLISQLYIENIFKKIANLKRISWKVTGASMLSTRHHPLEIAHSSLQYTSVWGTTLHSERRLTNQV